jgi:hypothetical protein
MPTTAGMVTSHCRPPPVPCRLSCRAVVFARRHRSMLACQLSPGWVPSLPSLRQRRLCLSAAVLARRHGSMPARQSPEWPSHWRPPRQRRADCAAAPPCSRDGMRASCAARMVSPAVGLPLLARTCRHAAVFARRHRSMLAYQPLLEWYSLLCGPPPCLCESCRHATVLTRQHRSMLACEPSP